MKDLLCLGWLIRLGLMKSLTRLNCLLLLALLWPVLPVFAQSHNDVDHLAGDPWEGWNRKVFVFNQTIDAYFLKPLAQAYQAVLPERAEHGVNNFFENLEIPITIVNSILQAKLAHAFEQSLRFTLNTGLGFGGIVNVARYVNLGMESTAAEDFAQTLQVWGVPQGPFLMLPLLGPTTVGGLPAYAVDYWLDPVNYHDRENSRHAIVALDVINTRVQYLPTDKLIRGDAYSFIRDAYLQRRHFLTKDGEIVDVFLDAE